MGGGLHFYQIELLDGTGSIAELGAFSFVPALRKKLVAVIEEHYYYERSFIKEGPLALLQQDDNSSVLSFPWGKTGDSGWVFDNDLCVETVKRIAHDLSYKMKKLAGSRSFRSDDHGHRMLLIADIIGIAGAMQETEIISFLGGLRLPDPQTDHVT